MGYTGKGFDGTSSCTVQQHIYLSDDGPNMLQIIYIGINLYSATMFVMKASILREWARLFVPCGSRNAFFWTCHILLAVTVLFGGSVLISTNLTCFPREKIWDKTKPGRCSDPKVILIISSVINVVLDLFILLLPQNIIWRLQMTKKKKVGMSLIFTIGILYDETPFLLTPLWHSLPPKKKNLETAC